MVLLGGDPGIGKSTLLIQMMASIPCDRLLYATGEETIGQAAIRAHRVGSAYERIQIVPETDVDLIIEHARAISAQILAVDSIQTMRTAGLPSAPGTVTQVRECTARLMRFAKDTHTTTILVGHVNKDGGLAGPETLQHLVDVILQFEPDPEFPAIRILRVMGKNRFGGTTETGSFEMTSEGLRSISPDDAPEARRERSEDAEDQMTPVAQELLYRFLELGGVVDAGLRDRIGDRLDLIPRSTS
jgi:DNA repair protein RadA/Sms